MMSSRKSVAGFSELRAGLANLREQGKYSDFVIATRAEQFPVHKVIICSLSEYFDKVCGGEFMVRIPSTHTHRTNNIDSQRDSRRSDPRV